MALNEKFTDLTEKAMNIGGKVITEVKKLKKDGKKYLNVAQRKNKIADKEMLLGRKCFALIKSGAINVKDPEMTGYIEEIDRLVAEIQKISESEIVCGSCGHTSDVPIKFCPSCGKKM